MTTLEPTVVPTVLRLLAASQPDMVRASQKDDTYIEQYVETTRDVIRCLFGPFRALQYARESKLLALLLYHGLTTGLGNSTLGEEYCGILQVSAEGLIPGPRRRLLLALLLSAGPYAADRLAGHLDNAAEEEAQGAAAAADAAETSASAEDPTVGPEDSLHHSPALSSTAAAVTGGYAIAHPSGEEAGGEEREQEADAGTGRRASSWASGCGPGSEAQAGAAEAGLAAARRASGCARGGRAWFRLLLAAAALRWARCWRALVLAWPRARPLLSYAGRLHLALFYMYGAYYSLPHRLAGIRYSVSMRPLNGRPSYRVLGLLLGLQLAVVVGLRTRAALRRLWPLLAGGSSAAKRSAQRHGACASGGADGSAAAADGRPLERYADDDEPAVLLADDPLGGWAAPEEEEEEEEQGPEGAEVAGIARSGLQVEAAVVGAAAGAGAGGGAGGLGVDDGGAATSGAWVGGGWTAPGPATGAAGLEGWEEVHRPEYGGSGAGAGWEADVFGVAHQLPQPQPPQQHHHHNQHHLQQRQAEGRLVAAGVPTALEFDGQRSYGSGTAVAGGPAGGALGAVSRGKASGGRSGSRGGQAPVLPVLTSLRQCPLCLSPKSHPTSTPCGHTFCWGCITTWCVEKPECPLCRAGVKLPQLVALYHTNC